MTVGRPALSGHTRVVGVIGDPVAHSLSPTLHNAAFEALGLDWVYVAFPVPRGWGAEAVAAVPALGLAGFNVTMPHKEDVAAACDELTADAAALRSVNTVVARPDGRTLGDSTDGPGFLDALADKEITVAGQPVLVLGAGGAARAVVLALGRAGALVTVAARRPEAAESAAALSPGARAVLLEAVAPLGPSSVRSAGAVGPTAFALIVNATPLGMSGGDALPVDPESLHAGQAVVDLVYHPADTPLLIAARARGARAVNGLGMLLHQAARSFTLWTGEPAPLDAMRAAVTAALAARCARPPDGSPAFTAALCCNSYSKARQRPDRAPASCPADLPARYLERALASSATTAPRSSPSAKGSGSSAASDGSASTTSASVDTAWLRLDFDAGRPSPAITGAGVSAGVAGGA